MKNSLDTIEKQVGLITSIKQIDAEIEVIQQVANLCANGKSKSSFTLIVEEECDVKKCSIDDFGDIVNDGGIKTIAFFNPVTGKIIHSQEMKNEEPPQKNTSKINFEISDVETLSVLGTVLSLKKERRNALVIKLKSLTNQTINL